MITVNGSYPVRVFSMSSDGDSRWMVTIENKYDVVPMSEANEAKTRLREELRKLGFTIQRTHIQRTCNHTPFSKAHDRPPEECDQECNQWFPIAFVLIEDGTNGWEATAKARDLLKRPPQVAAVDWRRHHANQADRAVFHNLVQRMVSELEENVAGITGNRDSINALVRMSAEKIASYSAQVMRAQVLGFDPDLLTNEDFNEEAAKAAITGIPIPRKDNS